MSDQLTGDHWTDEVSQAWVDYEIEESRRLGYSKSELSQAVAGIMPPGVRDYIVRQAAGELATHFASKVGEIIEIRAGTVQVEVDVNPID